MQRRRQNAPAAEVQTLASGELPEVLDAEQRAAAAEAKAQACADATAAAEAELSRLWDRSAGDESDSAGCNCISAVFVASVTVFGYHS